MALIDCPECKKQVSDTALTCSHCGFALRKPRRGPVGQIFKWLFILFNLAMAWWFAAATLSIGDGLDAGASDAELAGAGAAVAVVWSFIGLWWIVGALVLGLFVLMTKAKR